MWSESGRGLVTNTRGTRVRKALSREESTHCKWSTDLANAEVFVSERTPTAYLFCTLWRRTFAHSNLRRRVVVSLAAILVLGTGTAIADIYLPKLFPFFDLGGFSATYSHSGNIDLSGPFFQSLGTNGRTCGTCHAPSDGFGLSAVDAQIRYRFSRGKDPLFAQVDGSTCPTGPVDNSLVVNNGLIRIGLQVPPNSTDPNAAQYTIAAVQDPYGCA